VRAWRGLVGAIPGGAVSFWLVLYVLLRGLLTVGLVPPWQGPDEPGHLEWVVHGAQSAARITRGGADVRTKPGGEASMQARILADLPEHGFYRLTGAEVPSAPVARFADVPRLGNEVEQIGNETPVGYAPYVLARLLAPADDVTGDLMRLRLVSVALTGALVAVAAFVAVRLLPVAAVPAAVALVAAGPMVGFTGSVVNNDMSAAVLVAAWFAAWAVWSARPEAETGCRGKPASRWPPVRRGLALVALAILASAAKRTALFVLPVAAAVMVGGAIEAFRGGAAGRRRIPLAAAGLTTAVAIASLAPLAGRPAGWVAIGEARGAQRTRSAALEGKWGFEVVDASADAWTYIERTVPSGPGVKVEAEVWLRDAVAASAESHSAEPGSTDLDLDADTAAVAADADPGQPGVRDAGLGADRPTLAALVAEDGAGVWLAELVELPRDGSWKRAAVEGLTSPGADRLRIALVPGEGTIGGMGAVHADGLALRLDDRPVPINGGAEQPVRAGGAALAALARYTDAERAVRGVLTGLANPLESLERAGRALEFTFRSAWGGFGWLTVWPGAGHYASAGLISAWIGASLLVALVSPASLEAGPRGSRALRLCAVAAVLALALALAGSIAGAEAHRMPQGRYLVPALLPAAVPAAALAQRLLPGDGPRLLAAAAIATDLWLLLDVVWEGFL